MFLETDGKTNLGCLGCYSLLLPLPGYDHLGRKVIVCRWGLYDPRLVSAEDLMKASSIIFDVFIEEDDQASVTGHVLLGDCADLSVRHVAGFTLPFASKSMTLYQVRAALCCA